MTAYILGVVKSPAFQMQRVDGASVKVEEPSPGARSTLR